MRTSPVCRQPHIFLKANSCKDEELIKNFIAICCLEDGGQVWRIKMEKLLCREPESQRGCRRALTADRTHVQTDTNWIGVLLVSTVEPEFQKRAQSPKVGTAVLDLGPGPRVIKTPEWPPGNTRVWPCPQHWPSEPSLPAVLQC